MSFKLSEKSLKRLEGVHPDLVKVVQHAITITPLDFVVLEGLRSKERQRYLVDKGASKTMDSYHITGHAVDIAPIVGEKFHGIGSTIMPYLPSLKRLRKMSGFL